MDDLVIRLLGGVRALRGGRSIEVGGRRVRALLAVLALSADRSLPVELVVERVWDEADLPGRPRAGLQTLVSRLRASLGAEAVVTDQVGYRLAVPREHIDVLAYADRLGAAAQAPSTEEERAMLAAVLDEWDAPLFGEELSPWLRRHEEPRVTAVRLRAVERRVDLDLQVGEVEGCAEELRALIAEHPLRETLWVRLLRVLQVQGRRAEALEAYEQVRTRLAEELGADPAPALQEEHRRLLREEAPTSPVPVSRQSPPVPRQSPPVPRQSPPVPRQLPADVRGFTGRRRELDRLDALLLPPHRESGLVVVHGPGGGGKTSLAVHWANAAVDHFPDGQLVIDLRGFGPGSPLSPGLALDLLLRATGVPGDQIPETVEARSPLLRSQLAERRMLLLLDNAASEDQVRPLLPGGHNAVVVTSRRQLRGLTAIDGATPLPLGAMDPTDAVDLLRHRLGDTPARSEDVTELASACGCLPIALVVAAERAARQGRDGVRQLTDRLLSDRSRLPELSTGQDPLSDVRGVFATTADSLDPEAAGTFHLLAVHPGGPFSTGAAAALCGLEPSQVEDSLDDLVDRHLLRALRPGWYDLHDLARDYAAERLREADDHVAAASRDRLDSWLIHSAEAACMALGRYPPLIETGPLAPGTRPESFPGPRHARAWFAGHRRALGQSVQRAVEEEKHAVVCRMAPRLLYYLSLLSAGAEQVALARTALASAQALGEDEAITGAANNLGIVHGRARRTDEARHYFELSVRHAERAGHWLATHRARSNLALLHDITGEHDLAVEELTALLGDLHRLGMHESERPMLLNNLGNAHLHAGRPEEALRWARESYDVSRRVGAIDNEATALSGVGSAQLALGDVTAACASFAQAVQVSRAIGNLASEVLHLRELAVAERQADRPAVARRTAQQCLQVIEEIESTGGSSRERVTVEALLAEL